MLEVSYEYTYPKASIIHPLLIEEYFRSSEPIEYKEVEVICPKNFNLEIYCDKETISVQKRGISHTKHIMRGQSNTLPGKE